MNKKDYFDKNTYVRFLVPTVLALLGSTFSSFGNTLLAGRFLGRDALNMMSVLSSFTFMYAMTGCLISIGAASRSSLALGSQDYRTAAEYEWLAMVLSFVVPILLSLPCVIFFDRFFMLLGASPEACELGATYGRLMLAFGFLNTLTYFPFNYLRLIGRGRYGTYSFGLMGIIDVVLVYAFLRLGLGTVGIALGYVTSMIIANGMGLWFLLTKNRIFRISRPRASDVPHMLKNVISFGSASALNNLCKMLRTALMNVIVARFLGKDGVSSLAVGFSIINLASATVTGFGQAMSPIIGVLRGEHDRNGQHGTIGVSLRFAITFHAALAVIIMLFAPQISEFFGISDPEHVRETAIVVRLVAVSLIPSAAMNVLIYYYTAIGENRGARLLTAMHAFVFPVALAYVHLRIDSSGYYAASFIMAELLDLAVMAAYAGVRTKASPQLDGILLEERTYSEKFFSTTSDGTPDRAVEASERVVAFCEENDVNPVLCVKIPLVVEELLVTLARHCSEGDNARMDVRISLVGEKVVMRIRCEGRIFNPVAWYHDRKQRLTPEEFMDDDSFSMDVVDKVAKSVEYSNMFDVNNLIVTMGE